MMAEPPTRAGVRFRRIGAMRIFAASGLEGSQTPSGEKIRIERIMQERVARPMRRRGCSLAAGPPGEGPDRSLRVIARPPMIRRLRGGPRTAGGHEGVRGRRARARPGSKARSAGRGGRRRRPMEGYLRCPLKALLNVGSGLELSRLLPLEGRRSFLKVKV